MDAQPRDQGEEEGLAGSHHWKRKGESLCDVGHRVATDAQLAITSTEGTEQAQA